VLIGETFFAKIQYLFKKRNLKPILIPLEKLKAVKNAYEKVFGEKVMEKRRFFLSSLYAKVIDQPITFLGLIF
jgi:hypothetical protein